MQQHIQNPAYRSAFIFYCIITKGGNIVTILPPSCLLSLAILLLDRRFRPLPLHLRIRKR